MKNLIVLALVMIMCSITQTKGVLNAVGSLALGIAKNPTIQNAALTGIKAGLKATASAALGALAKP